MQVKTKQVINTDATIMYVPKVVDEMMFLSDFMSILVINSFSDDFFPEKSDTFVKNFIKL